jgi:hypothetical protein
MEATVKNDYGTVTVGAGKPDQREIKIVNYVRSIFKDNRFVSCAKLEDGSYCLTVENLASSGRNTQNSIWLSEESFVGFITNFHLYLVITGMDLTQLAKEALDSGIIRYNCSDNLTPLATDSTDL